MAAIGEVTTMAWIELQMLLGSQKRKKKKKKLESPRQIFFFFAGENSFLIFIYLFLNCHFPNTIFFNVNSPHGAH